MSNEGQNLPASKDPGVRKRGLETAPHGSFIVGHQLLRLEDRKSFLYLQQNSLVHLKLLAGHDDVKDAHGLAMVIGKDVEHL